MRKGIDKLVIDQEDLGNRQSQTPLETVRMLKQMHLIRQTIAEEENGDRPSDTLETVRMQMKAMRQDLDKASAQQQQIVDRLDYMMKHSGVPKWPGTTGSKE